MKKEEYRSHKLHAVIDDLVENVRSIERDRGGFSESFQELISKFQYISWCLENSDTRLLSQRLLDDLYGKANQCLGVVQTITSLFGESPEPQDFEERLNANVENLEKRASALVDEMRYPIAKRFFDTDANREIEDVIDRAAVAITELEKLREAEATSIAVAVAELTDNANKIREDLSNYGITLKESGTQLTQLKTSIESLKDEKSKEFDKVISDHRSKVIEWRVKLENEGKEYLEKIVRMYRLSADNTLSGRFFSAAEKERGSYIATTVGAVLFFLGAISVILIETFFRVSFFERFFTEPLYLWLSKLSLIVVFLVPAGYLSAMASRHRKADVWYRTMGVRIATLKPYLDEFDASGDTYKEQLPEILKSFFVSEISSEEKPHTLFSNQSSSLRRTIEQIQKLKDLIG